MKKKTLVLLVIALMLLSLMPQPALAAASVTTDKTSALPGETVSISGKAFCDESVVIKITDEAGNIVFFYAVKADASGKYKASFVVPNDMTASKLTVTAGSGSDVGTATMTIKTKPASTPSPSSSASQTATPSAAPTPAASEDKPAPSESDEKVIAQTGHRDSGGWMIAVYIAAGLLILAAVAWILLHRGNKQKQDNR